MAKVFVLVLNHKQLCVFSLIQAAYFISKCSEKYVPKYISVPKRSISAPRLRLIGTQTHRHHQYFDFKIAQRTLFWKTGEQWLNGKESAASGGDTGDVGLIPELGRSPGGGNGKPLQYSWLENSMDRGTWQATIHWVTKSQTRLSSHIRVCSKCREGLCFLWQLTVMTSYQLYLGDRVQFV